LLAVFGIVLASCGVSRAGDPNSTFEQAYGEEARKTPPKDMAAFALRLATDAGNLKDDQALGDFLLTKAFEFYLRAPAGDARAKAGDAIMEPLVALGDRQRDEKKPAEAEATYQRAYRVASLNNSSRVNEIMARIKALQSRAELDKRLVDLQAQVKAAPYDSAPAKTLALLYVLDLDKPADAAGLLQAAKDESLKTYVPLAAGETGKIEEQALKELAAWYESLAPAASPAGKITAYRRARTYYELFLGKHTRQDGDSLLAKKSMETIEKELTKLGSGGVAGYAGHHVVYVVQSSGSMINVFEDVKADLRAALAALDANSQDFHVIFYSKGPLQEPVDNRLVSATAPNKAKVTEYLVKAYAAGSTDPAPALKKAFDVLDAARGQGTREIVLFTNGNWTGTTSQWEKQVVDLCRVRNAAKGVHLNVLLYDGGNAGSEGVLQKLAEDNGGKVQKHKSQ
jgi:hypothetical protein